MSATTISCTFIRTQRKNGGHRTFVYQARESPVESIIRSVSPLASAKEPCSTLDIMISLKCGIPLHLSPSSCSHRSFFCFLDQQKIFSHFAKCHLGRHCCYCHVHVRLGDGHGTKHEVGPTKCDVIVTVIFTVE